MLVVANGANKCGSTWLASILLEIIRPESLPAQFHDQRHGSIPTIRTNMLRQFLDEVNYHDNNYVSKNHFFYERRLLSKYPNVRVLDIHRNMADMLVSLFFHSAPQMKSATSEQVKQAYWQYGPPIVEFVARYHSVWGIPSSWTYTSSYERLKADPQGEIRAIASFLGDSLTARRVDEIVESTKFSRLAERLSGIDGMERRFRKGVIGDHKNYFDPAIVEHIRHIEARNASYPCGLYQRVAFACQCYRYAGHERALPYQATLSSRRLAVPQLS
jgi:hypothetical protein